MKSQNNLNDALISYDWLGRHKSLDGLCNIMTKIEKRTRFDSNLGR